VVRNKAFKTALVLVEIVAPIREGSMNTRMVLPDLAAMQRQIEELQALLKAKDGKALAFKVTEKGAVSVYGLQRFPVTLYAGQWERWRGLSASPLLTPCGN